MKKGRDYLQNIAEIRTMMERSSRFLSLSGWAGVLAGIDALVAAYLAHTFLHFRPTQAAGPAQLPLGFGLMHIVSGVCLYLKYER